MCAIRWSAAIRIFRSESQKSVSEGLCPGRCWTSKARSRRTRDSPSASGRVTCRVRSPAAEAPRDAPQGEDHVLRDPVAQHQRAGEIVVGVGALLVAGEVVDRDVDRGDLRARARLDDLDQAEVVDVLVGDDHQLQVVDCVAEVRELVLELVERLARVGPGVDERQRLVLDQVAVDPPDGERSGDREPVDALGSRPLESLLGGQDRIRSRTSSRFSPCRRARRAIRG